MINALRNIKGKRGNMPRLRIQKPDDTGTYWEVDYEVINECGRNTYPGNYSTSSYHRGGGDNVINGIIANLPQALSIPNRGYYGTWARNVTINGFTILIEKTKTRYRVLGKMVNKAVMLRAMAKVFFRAAQGGNVSELFNVLMTNLNVPDNVAYALENRVPYYFYKREGVYPMKVEVSLNVQMISEKKCALEISDGRWAEISVANLNSMINFYRHGNRKSSWKNLSPSKLWEKLYEKKPTKLEEKVMIAFLEQNRTKDLVEKRARELMDSLAEQYPDRIAIKKIKDSTWMFVRGKIADWGLVDNKMKEGLQMVSTYVFGGHKDEINLKLEGIGGFRGSICIDNLSSDSNVGDQFATRAIALMNDVITVGRVNTIKRYLPEESGYKIGQKKYRIDWNELQRMQEQ
tara:strand:- start:352 stop:1563 length:1212 start_codon:yes stop_codon:yes gene_type:complete